MEGKETTVIEFNSKKPSFSAPFVMYSNLRKNRELMKHFIKRDLKIRYHNSIIGYGWSVIEPLSLTVTFYVLFAILSDDTDPYRPLTILLGLLAWALFAKTFSTGTYSIQRNASLIKRVYFPARYFYFLNVDIKLSIHH